ncbi:MAG: hypothetical protein WCK37_03715 [Candidatus Falkowbacteria bacterium]
MNQIIIYSLLAVIAMLLVIIKILVRKRNLVKIKMEVLSDLVSENSKCSIKILEKLVKVNTSDKIYSEIFVEQVRLYFVRFLDGGEILDISNYISQLNKNNNRLLWVLMRAASKISLPRLVKIYRAALESEYNSRNKVFRETMDFILWVILENSMHDKFVVELRKGLNEQKISNEIQSLIKAEITRIEKSKEWKNNDEA